MVNQTIKKLALSAKQLIAKQSVAALKFKDTNELTNLSGILGQKKAKTALALGLEISNSGYNIYVMGETGTGRTVYVKHYLSEKATKTSTPNDWMYINDFIHSQTPKAIQLPASLGQEIHHDCQTLITQLFDVFPAAFENPIYQQKKHEIERTFNKRYDAVIDTIEQQALKNQIALFRESTSLTFSPTQEGKPLEETEFARLSDTKRKLFNKHISQLEATLNDKLSEMPQWKHESNEKLQQLNHMTIDQTLLPLFNPLETKYKAYQPIIAYLESVKKDLHINILNHLHDERSIGFKEDINKRNFFIERYIPNLIVTNEANSPAPVIFESHPTYRNLFGRIEYTTDMGALTTNYSQIKPGSLHKANGGFLIIEANKILEEPSVWDALKRTLKSKQLKIEPQPLESNFVMTVSLIPEPIPISVKIILIGPRPTYYLMQEMDHEFHELFRILVDFENHIERNPETVHAYARLIKSRADEKNMPPLTAQAVAVLIEHSSRLAEHKEQLTAHIRDIFNLMLEANHILQAKKENKITHHHINAAIDAQSERVNRISKEMLKEILEDAILIETTHQQVGKINGLTVLSIGETSFGSPVRITATTYPGSQGIVDIEREVQLGQSIHSKGVLILTGYLGNKYAKHFTMGISAHIVMEQSYGYIDGDSASLAELCCLISALIQLPISQSFAVTGSINQHGEVQAIGCVNEKIEGFFDLCDARGLTGNQGVIIPACNIRNLMLSNRVIAAHKKGLFFIFSVKTVDEALSILFEKNAGNLSLKTNKYPKNSINELVQRKLKQIADINKDTAND
ncbi:MAG: AAA family ATPase [Endozoicomonadaceae bacterium]|nr:AAA family ATPase [Endozoicomonadaceae bacterium]